MTRIEEAIQKASDMREFYRRIPKITGRVAESQPRPNQSIDTCVSDRVASRHGSKRRSR